MIQRWVRQASITSVWAAQIEIIGADEDREIWVHEERSQSWGCSLQAARSQDVRLRPQTTPSLRSRPRPSPRAAEMCVNAVTATQEQHGR